MLYGMVLLRHTTVKPLLSGHPLLNGHFSNYQKSVPLFTVNLTSIKRTRSPFRIPDWLILLYFLLLSGHIGIIMQCFDTMTSEPRLNFLDHAIDVFLIFLVTVVVNRYNTYTLSLLPILPHYIQYCTMVWKTSFKRSTSIKWSVGHFPGVTA